MVPLTPESNTISLAPAEPFAVVIADLKDPVLPSSRVFVTVWAKAAAGIPRTTRLNKKNFASIEALGKTAIVVLFGIFILRFYYVKAVFLAVLIQDWRKISLIMVVNNIDIYLRFFNKNQPRRWAREQTRLPAFNHKLATGQSLTSKEPLGQVFFRSLIHLL